MERRNLLRDKQGDLQSMFFAIIAIFAIGILFFFSSKLFGEMNAELDTFLQREGYNNTEAQETIENIREVDETNRVWDYGFLGIYLMYIVILGFTAFSTRISPIFFWVYIIVALIGLFIGTILSNSWQELAIHPQFADTITRFPITDLLLGSYFPIAITAAIAIFLVLLFGKPGGNQ